MVYSLHGKSKFLSFIVATQNNAGPISLAIKKAAKRFIRGGDIREGLLNRVEMAFRAFDPCQSCATHAQGQTPLQITIRDKNGTIIKKLPMF